MRVFRLIREQDVSGVSGVGRVAEVAELENGKVVLGWLPRHTGKPASVALYDSLEDLLAIHGHDGATRLEPVYLNDLE